MDLTRDTRPVQVLNEITQPSFLKHREGGTDTARDSGGGTKALPKLRLQQSQSAEDGNMRSWDKGSGAWSPVAAARAQLAAEKPAMMQRMDLTVDHCRIARDNRNYRFNSLGVFDGGQNEVRARSMLRVQMHKELSTTSMRLPHTQKEIKLERPDDSLNSRLEKMCARVLKSIHDDKPPRPAALNTKGSPMDRWRRDHHPPHSASPSAAGALRSHVSGIHQHLPELDVELSSPYIRSPSRRLFALGSNVSRACSRVTSMRASFSQHLVVSTPKSPMQHNHHDWAANLPPELAAAQIAHLTAVTKQHIHKYHAAIIEAQQEALQAAGIEGGMTADKLQEQVQAQLELARPGMEEAEEEVTSVNEVSRLVHTTHSIPELIAAALQHCSSMAQDLEVFKATLPKKESNEKQSRRKPSVPMNQSSKKMMAISDAAVLEATESPSATSGGAAVSPAGPAAAEATIWPSFLPPSRNARLSGSSMADPCGTDDEGHDEDQGAGSPAGHTPAAEAPYSPSPPPAPTINHTPITPKKLAAFRQALQDAAAAVNAGKYQLPQLPTLPPAPTASLHVQARLERVCDLLHLPLAIRLDSVLAFTARERALQFEHALKIWETCAVGVCRREELLGTLSTLQLGITGNTLGYVSVQQVTDQCLELHQVTCAVQRTAEQLVQQHGLVLRYDGDEAYPGPDAVDAEDMVRFMEWLRDTPTSVRIMA